MSTRSGNLAKESLSVDSVKRKLDFDEPSARVFRAPIWKTTKSRRLDFGETHPLVRLRYPDLLPDRIDFDSLTSMRSAYVDKRTIFTSDQKETLEAMFRTTKYPTRQEKATLSAELDITISQVQTWFNNRRQKLKKEQKKGAARPSGSRPIFPKVSLIKTVKRTVSFSRFPQFPTQLQVPSQPLPSTPYPATVPFASVSRHVTESFGTQLHQQQPLPVATETGSLPYQQAYAPFPGPLRRISQQRPQTNHIAQPTTAPSYPAHHSLPLVNPVEPDIHQAAAADSSCLADEFPFSYSIAKELPHIFGNLEEDEVLDRLLTPAIEPPNDCEPLWDSLAPESDQFLCNPASLPRENFTAYTSPDRRHFQPVGRYSSCCYGNREMTSPPLRELSYGFISKGRSFRFCRQD